MGGAADLCSGGFFGFFPLLAVSARHKPWHCGGRALRVRLFRLVAGFLVVEAPKSLASRALAFRPLIFVGKVSYGIFVFHTLIAVSISPWLKAAGIERNKLLIFACGDSCDDQYRSGGGKLELDGATFKPLGAKSGI